MKDMLGNIFPQRTRRRSMKVPAAREAFAAEEAGRLVDMDLVRDIDTSFVKQQMLHAFRVMAEKIDARLIAEGVETREELETVREIGVDYVQGYLLAKPSAAFQLTPDIKL